MKRSINKRFSKKAVGLVLGLPLLIAPTLASADYAGVATASKTVDGHAAQLVYANLGDKNLEVKVVNADGEVGETESLASLAKDNNALAAMNGGYFNAYSDNQPLTVVRSDGEFEHNGSFGAVFGIDELNRTYFGRVYPVIQGSTKGSWSWPNNWAAWGINHYYDDPNAITVLTPDVKKRALSGGRTVVVQNGVVTKIVDGDASIPENGFLVHYGSGVASSADVFKVGEKAAYKIRYQDAQGNEIHWEHVFNMMGGGPLLVYDGDLALNPEAEKFTDPKQTSKTIRSTRTFVGVNGSNRLVMGTVSNVTVYELADVAHDLGLVYAVGMDSGATAGLYANGQYVTQPGREIPNAIVVRLRSQAPGTASGFLDVSDNYFASDAIKRMHDKGVMNGAETNGKLLFHPEDTLTRGELATLLTRAFDLKAAKPTLFADTAGGWCESYAQAAMEAGYMNGYSTTEFGADDAVTEEQVVAIFSKILTKYGVKPTLADRWIQDKPSDWAEKDVHTAFQQGLLSDTFGDRAFAPLDKANRAGVATLLDVLFQKIGK